MIPIKRLVVPTLLALASFAVCFLVLISPAPAADKGGPIPGVTRAEAEAMFPSNVWTAVYASIGIGTGAMVSDTLGLGVDGYQLSGRIGGDVQINRIVIGLLTDYGFDHTTGVFGNVNPKEWMVAARAGVLVTDSALVYGLAGERWLSQTGLNTQGITVGGGIEVAMTKHWRLDLEYNRTTYDAPSLATAVEQTVSGRLILALPR
jgi:opacity protein-like surface antigen